MLRKRLTGPLLKVIPQLTGLRLHVLWHKPLEFKVPTPVLCPMARQRAVTRIPQPKRCVVCLRRRWKISSRPANRGRRFIGLCGATNFCASLKVDTHRPLTLALQAKVKSPSRSPHKAGPRRGGWFWAKHIGKTVSPATFHHAVDLARLILHDLQSTAQARGAVNTQAEAPRRGREFRHRLPDVPESTVQPGLGSHRRKLVQAMLDYVHQNYHRPIGLGELALEMKMNASYLSALFSHTTGVAFHHFLEEARLSKARDLLRNPRNHVGEVARAVGYASYDAFRHAFKAHEGLSPEAWRAGQ
ncbi:MAG: helix-turn-helix domain-containing protein [Limisphaerales bacterium]